MLVNWSAFKQYATTKAISMQWIDLDGSYYLAVVDGQFKIECILNKHNLNDDLIDFETNYKAISNKSLVVANAPFASKILPDGSRLFRRVRGTTGTVQNTPVNIDFSVPFTKCKITGLQILNAKLGDKAAFQVLDTPQGTISGVPNALLNVFGQDVYIVPNLAEYPSRYDADLIQGMTLRLVYDATDELLPRTIYVNFDLHEVVA